MRRIEFDDETKRLMRQAAVYKFQAAAVFVLSAALAGQLLAMLVPWPCPSTDGRANPSMMEGPMSDETNEQERARKWLEETKARQDKEIADAGAMTEAQMRDAAAPTPEQRRESEEKMTMEPTQTFGVSEHIMQFFAFAHLPPHLAAVSAPFSALADELLKLPRNPERTVALRKLLEAKDAAVRAALAK